MTKADIDRRRGWGLATVLLIQCASGISRFTRRATSSKVTKNRNENDGQKASKRLIFVDISLHQGQNFSC